MGASQVVTARGVNCLLTGQDVVLGSALRRIVYLPFFALFIFWSMPSSPCVYRALNLHSTLYPFLLCDCYAHRIFRNFSYA